VSWKSAERLSLIPAAVLVLGLWLPRATVTFLGEAALTANGQEIGSGLFDWPVGWIAAGGGAIAFGGTGALLDRKGLPTLIGGAIALLATGYTLLAIPGQETGYAAEGVPIGEAIQVEYAWGLFLLVAAAIALVIIGVRLLSQEEARKEVSG
jgi:hypothetical protein